MKIPVSVAYLTYELGRTTLPVCCRVLFMFRVGPTIQLWSSPQGFEGWGCDASILCSALLYLTQSLVAHACQARFVLQNAGIGPTLENEFLRKQKHRHICEYSIIVKYKTITFHY